MVAAGFLRSMEGLVLAMLFAFASDEAFAGPDWSLVLTDRQPRASTPLPDAIIRRAPAILRVVVTQLRNPSLASVSVHVSIRWEVRAAEPREPARIGIGGFTFLPPDRPGTFLLRTSEAFEQLRHMEGDLTRVQAFLDFEARPVLAHEAFPPLQITIGSLEWSDR